MPRGKPHLTGSFEVLTGLFLQAEVWEGREGRKHRCHTCKNGHVAGNVLDGASCAFQLPLLPFSCNSRPRSPTPLLCHSAPPDCEGQRKEETRRLVNIKSPGETTKEEKSFPQLLEKQGNSLFLCGPQNAARPMNPWLRGEQNRVLSSLQFYSVLWEGKQDTKGKGIWLG